MKLGSKLLVEWRRDESVSQAQAAKRFGVSQPSYREWEHDTVPELTRAFAIEQITHGKVPAKSWSIELDEHRNAQLEDPPLPPAA
jgi:transcriptional regulator with XRE-family HTH domain